MALTGCCHFHIYGPVKGTRDIYTSRQVARSRCVSHGLGLEVSHGDWHIPASRGHWTLDHRAQTSGLSLKLPHHEESYYLVMTWVNRGDFSAATLDRNRANDLEV